MEKKSFLSPNIIGFLIALGVSIISMWIYFTFIQKKSDHIIDNPTNNTLKVVIDNQNYTIAPNQQVIVHLKQGNHTLSATTDKDSVLINNQVFTVNKVRGIINPNKEKYFIFGLPYGPKVNVDSIFEGNILNYKGKEYHGDVKIDSSFYVEDFYYNLNEDFPKIAKKSENHTLRKKVFREDDFKQYYFENFE